MVGKGEYIGTNQFYLPSDIAYAVCFLITALIPAAGLYLILSGSDILIAYFNDQYYCCISTLCFYSLSVVIDIGCECAKRVPSVIYSFWTKTPRKEKKILKGIIYQDAVLGYYAICVIMTLWLQYNLFDLREAGFILLCWIGLCAFFRFLRMSGKREIKE